MSSSTRSPRRAAVALRGWSLRRWAVAACAAVGTALLVGLPTAVVPSPLFSRAVPVQWWNYPTLALTAVLGGIVLATYLRTPETPATAAGEAVSDAETGATASSRTPKEAVPGRGLGSVGGVLSFVAVGCPVCNKLAAPPARHLRSTQLLGAFAAFRRRGVCGAVVRGGPAPLVDDGGLPGPSGRRAGTHRVQPVPTTAL